MDWIALLSGHVATVTLLAAALGSAALLVVLRWWLTRRRWRRAVAPAWEPVPWKLSGRAAREQKKGFEERARMPIVWQRVPWQSFPAEGIFGHDREWFSSRDVAYFAVFAGEDLILIQLTWHGWPDPPEWGLASRRSGLHEGLWNDWGYFPDIPATWTIPTA